MIPRPCDAPIGDFPVEWMTTWKPPGSHSHLSVEVILPAGIIGFCLMSPSIFQVPTKYPSLLTSGPGLGASIFFSGAAAFFSAPAFLSCAGTAIAAISRPEAARIASLEFLMVFLLLLLARFLTREPAAAGHVSVG